MDHTDFKFLRKLRKEYIVFLTRDIYEYQQLILPHVGEKQTSWGCWTEKNVPDVWKDDIIIICPGYRFKEDVAKSFPDHYEVEI